MNKQQTTQIQWKEIELNTICDVRDGTHDSPKYLDTGYPLITSKNLVNGIIDFQNVNYISEEDYIKINKRSFVDNGDIIMPMIGTIGNPILVEKKQDFAIKNVALIKFNNKNISNKYIKYVLSSSYFEDYILKKSRGGTQKFLSLSDIRAVLIPIPYKDNKPDLETQKRIVEKLEIAEKLKENRKKADELTKEYLNSVFLEMFGDPFKNSFSWKKEELKKHVILINGRAYSQHELLDSGTQIIRIQNLNGGNNWYYSNLNLPENKYCNKGDLLFAWSGTFGPFIWNSERSIYHYHIWKLELKNSINKNYIYYFLSLLSENIKKSGHGGIITHKTKESMDKLLIPIPPIQLQNEFAKIVEGVEQLKEFQLKSKEEIDNLYNKLMQQAFKGEL